MKIIKDLNIFVHANAKKHGLNEDEVANLWANCFLILPRNDEILLALSTQKGKDYELIAKRLNINSFVVFHCFTPPTKKFLDEIERS